MPRKKATRARGLTYAQKLARLRTVYAPSFRARKRFSPQQKSAITRKWRRERQRAAYYYSKGFRLPPKKEKHLIPGYVKKLTPPRKKKIPKKPPRIVTKKKKDTRFADMTEQPIWRMVDYCKSMVRANRIVRVLFKIRAKDRGKSPTFDKDTSVASSGWYWLGGYDDESIEEFLNRWGEIVAIASVPRRPI